MKVRWNYGRDNLFNRGKDGAIYIFQVTNLYDCYSFIIEASKYLIIKLSMNPGIIMKEHLWRIKTRSRVNNRRIYVMKISISKQRLRMHL